MPGCRWPCASALKWFETESQVLFTTISHAAKNNLDTYAWQISWTLADFLDRQGNWRSVIATHQTGLTAGQRQDDLAGQMRMHGGLARAYEATEYYRHAYTLFSKLDDRYKPAETLIRLGDTHNAASEVKAARDAWQDALKSSTTGITCTLAECAQDLTHQQPDRSRLSPSRTPDQLRDGSAR